MIFGNINDYFSYNKQSPRFRGLFVDIYNSNLKGVFVVFLQTYKEIS